MKDSVYADMEDSERQVADCLRELDLWWCYEFPVFVYDEKKRPRRERLSYINVKSLLGASDIKLISKLLSCDVGAGQHW
ncbi:MAG: hypothetical protein OEZ29_09520 [Candidatus Bathyarchaeota archaeon]|nr:hypothetical protein [Candidatus Bathyarchaeota archaeon]